MDFKLTKFDPSIARQGLQYSGHDIQNRVKNGQYYYEEVLDAVSHVAL